MKKEKSLKNCFVVAPATVDITPLRKLLESRGIKVRDMLSVPISKVSISKTIEKEIHSSDFLCAVIPSKAPPSIFYEVGLARGARKPIFLIFEEKGVMPSDLQDVVYVRTSIKGQKVIEFALDQFLSRYPQRPKYTRRRIKYTKYAKKRPKYTYRGIRYAKKRLDITSLQQQLRHLSKEAYEVEMESFVARLFEHFNDVVAVRKDPSYVSKGVDMALWIDTLESSLGNPVLVEVKSGKLSDSMLINAENQLRGYLEQTNASVALLIYFDHERRRFKPLTIRWPLVIWLELRNLLSMLSRHSLADVIVTQRNRMVHSPDKG